MPTESNNYGIPANQMIEKKPNQSTRSLSNQKTKKIANNNIIAANPGLAALGSG